MKNSFDYISGDGKIKDVRTLDNQYLINALAKSYREFLETRNTKYLANITNIQNELDSRLQKILFEGDKNNGR